MEPYKFYIEQCSFDGESYTRGTPRETYETWNIVCSKSVYRHFGDPKEVSSRNWFDEHGEDVYIPANVKLKKFDLEVSFLCNGEYPTLKDKVKSFLLFLMGKNWRNEQGNLVASTGSRLVLYDGDNSIGWKDVRFKSFATDAFLKDNSDVESVLEFKIIFEVNDPYTTVWPYYRYGRVELVFDSPLNG